MVTVSVFVKNPRGPVTQGCESFLNHFCLLARKSLPGVRVIFLTGYKTHSSLISAIQCLTHTNKHTWEVACVQVTDCFQRNSVTSTSCILACDKQVFPFNVWSAQAVILAKSCLTIFMRIMFTSLYITIIFTIQFLHKFRCDGNAATFSSDSFWKNKKHFRSLMVRLGYNTTLFAIAMYLWLNQNYLRLPLRRFQQRARRQAPPPLVRV